MAVEDFARWVIVNAIRDKPTMAEILAAYRVDDEANSSTPKERPRQF